MKKLILCSLIIFISIGSLVMSQDEASEEPKKEEAVPLETTNLANRRLEAILKLHQLFDAKMSAPEFGDFISGKMNRWQKEGKIKVPANTQWNSMKSDMNRLGSELLLIKRDKQFVDQLRKDHATYEALQSFQRSLAKITKLPTKAKSRAFIPLLNAYAHQLYTNKLLEKTNAILAQVTPEKEAPSAAPYESFDSSFEPYPSDTGFDDFGAPADFDAEFGDGFDFDLGSDFEFDFDAF